MDEYDICPRKNFIEKRCKILFNEIKFKSWLYHPPHLITRCDGDEAKKGADKSHIHNISLVQFNIFFIAGHQTCPRSPVPTQD